MRKLLVVPLAVVPMAAMVLGGSSEAPGGQSSISSAPVGLVAESAERILPVLEITSPTRGQVVEYDPFDSSANVLTVRLQVRREGGGAGHENLCAVKELLVSVVPTDGSGGDLIANEGALFPDPGVCPASETYEFSWDYDGKPPGTYDIVAHVEASSPLEEEGPESGIELVGVNEGMRITLVDPAALAEGRVEAGLSLALSF